MGLYETWLILSGKVASGEPDAIAVKSNGAVEFTWIQIRWDARLIINRLAIFKGAASHTAGL
jgi:hypothetical protein